MSCVFCRASVSEAIVSTSMYHAIGATAHQRHKCVIKASSQQARARSSKGLKIVHIHPSHRMGINARRGLDSTLQYIRVLSLVFEKNTQVADDLEAHTLLVLAWECWCSKGLGDKVGGPTAQLDVRVGCGERQDSHHDLRVVGLGVAEDGLFGILQLLELLAHRLHVGGSHVGWYSCRQAEGRGRQRTCRFLLYDDRWLR